MATGLLLDYDQAVAQWVANKHQTPVYGYDHALGLIDKERKLVGAIMFRGWNGADVEISYYGKNMLTVGIVRTLARYILEKFDPARLTAITSKRNRQFMKALQKLGFRVEGIQRCFYGRRDCNRNTGVRFVAFRDEIERVAKYPTEANQRCS